MGAIYAFADYLDRDIVYISHSTKQCVFVDKQGVRSQELCKEYNNKNSGVKYIMYYVE